MHPHKTITDLAKAEVGEIKPKWGGTRITCKEKKALVVAAQPAGIRIKL